ncbi:MAG: DNA repair protein RecO [Bacteroidetes bacterium]|nr:MAG: DNA repair protein RecO [Bacteroidota bacterium]
MIHRTRGIVLHTTRYGESSLVVHCFTEQSGRQSYMVKGVRGSKKQSRPNLFQPLSILEFEVYHKNSREIQLVKEVSRSVPLNSIPFDITKSTQAIFMAEVLYRVVRESAPDPMLSHYLVNAIKYLDALEIPSPDFHIVFLFHLTRFLGLYPQNNHSKNNRFFDLVSGHFISGPGDPDIMLDEKTSRLWSLYIHSDFQTVNSAGFNGIQRKVVLNELIRYFRLHIEGMGEIRSLEVLHEFFHS